jgi:L-glyceraldehyde 3-phosphate reductase
MYKPSEERYESMTYHRCGKSGIQLPAISLGLWHNFGSVDDFATAQKIIRFAFDKGITHFDLANNYGPVPGSAEENFGRILKQDFIGNLRDEMLISTKAGYNMWPGPYGDWGSRKYLLSSLDQSLKRMQLDYVDIFYSHRPDPITPIEETMGALAHAVKSGKALYVGLSNYNPVETTKAVNVLKEMGVKCLIHQPKYSMFERWVEDGLLEMLDKNGIGCIAFSPLAQGMLTDKYLNGIPANSRAAKEHGFLKATDITEERLKQIRDLNELASTRGQTLAQMALAWLLRDKKVTSVLVGASSVEQLDNSLGALKNQQFTGEESVSVEKILRKTRVSAISKVDFDRFKT